MFAFLGTSLRPVGFEGEEAAEPPDEMTTVPVDEILMCVEFAEFEEIPP